MKIDVHVHTKKVKQGDAESRNINPKMFHEIVSATDVRIIAITNHNHFDKAQYESILKEVGDEIQVWPGVELDIDDDGKRAHLLIIISPQKVDRFDSILQSILAGNSADNFKATINAVLNAFDVLEPIYIAHYLQKKPDLSDESIQYLIKNTKFPNRVIKEVTNAISAGIYISHGHRSIYGSDVQDWNEYEDIAMSLPEIRLPVESFEHFCLLLEKDTATIKTLLDLKAPEMLELYPFEDKKRLDLKVYNDINVFFGSKGTGKTKILEAIAKYFQGKGINASVFESKSEKLETLFDLKGKKFSIDLKDYGIDYCTNEIVAIKNASEVAVTNISRYVQYFSTDIRNKSAKLIKIKDYSLADVSQTEHKFKGINNTQTTLNAFNRFINSDKPLIENINSMKLESLKTLIISIIEEVELLRATSFCEYKTNQLFNNAISVYKREVSKKTSTPEKPSETGFLKYALNRINLELMVQKISSNIKKSIEYPNVFVGSLGKKGELYCKTDVVIQNGHFSDGKLNPIANVNKSPQKEFSRKIFEIEKSIYGPELFVKISELKAIENIDTIATIHELVLFNRYFIVNGSNYSPSNGEVSMLLLQNELSLDKDVYILDEPEKSLGNEYISEVIVPMIKEKARTGKRVFISTHDANIAVRTLPYNSIYREHQKDGYEMYVGNPFSNNLVSIKNSENVLDWKVTSMKTLEGGKEAFGERGRIYGSL
jgi:predicted ATPase